MPIRKLTAILAIVFVCAKGLWALDEPKVALKRVEDRTEATVSSERPAEQAEEGGILEKTFTPVGDGIMAVAHVSSQFVGKSADLSIKTVQVIGGFLLSPIFRTLDVTKRKAEKQEGG